MKDFPAAHSNDTEWFAVDENGTLAFFDARAEGASPILYSEDSLYDSWFDITQEQGLLIFQCDFPVHKYPGLHDEPGIFKTAAESGVYDDRGSFDLVESVDSEDGEELLELSSEYAEYKQDVYLFLVSDQKVIPELAPGVTAFYFPDLSETELGLVIVPVTMPESYGENVNQLIKGGKVRGFAGVDPAIYFLSILRDLPMYHFEPENGGFNYPYEKVKSPQKLMTVNDISSDFPFQTEKLSADFTTMNRIQLMEIGYEYDDIYTWNGAGWVALDGKVYDFDGNYLGMEEDR